MDQVIEWLPAAGILLLGGLGAGVLYLGRFRPAAARRRALARQAERDYAAARGSAHLAILRRGQKRLQARHAQLQAALFQAQARGESLKTAQSEALVAALENHLAHDCFEDDVEGVGPVLAQRILARAFHGRLADLTRASGSIDGIGESRQEAINAWVRDCRRREPTLLQTNFPGRTAVLQRFGPALAEIAAEVGKLGAQQAALIPQLDQVEQAIAKLAPVSVRNFEQALAEPGRVDPALDQYLRGVFAEWEPAPAWFAQLSPVDEKPEIRR